ncbi:hypothetical protein [Sphingopyxis terrae]|uniref:hypothetical protein n=1 Tax=Sphingopyxis terrae TaxID=33052 RepID=UPI000AA0D616|nr:hypothetical protein [Sphingopyxis terrae]
MTGSSCSYVLDISEPLFYLTTETLRLHSNQTKRYQTLTTFMSKLILDGRCPLEDHPPATIRDHLTAVPSGGGIRIRFRISQSNADALSNVKERLGILLGSRLSDADTVSILLFDYVATRNAERILRRLQLDQGDDEASPKSQDRRQNIVPLK